MEVPKIEQRTFEQLQVVDVFAFGEVKLVPQERVQQRVDCMKRVPKVVLQDGVQRWYAEQSAEFPASQDMKEPVCTACGCGAGRRLGWRITCRRGDGRSLNWRIACWSDMGRSLSTSVSCPNKKSCVAGTDSRVFSLWMTYNRGRGDTKSCMAGTDSRVYAPCRPRVWGKLRDEWVEGPEVEGPSSRCRWWVVLLVGKTGLSSPLVGQAQLWAESSQRLKGVGGIVFASPFDGVFRRTSTCDRYFSSRWNVVACD